MKIVYFFIVAMLLTTLQLSAQTWQWTHPEPNGVEVTSYPDPYANEDDKVHDVETDAAGNVYVLGNFMDSLYLSNNFITKNNGSYLAKYDSTGKLLWYKLIIPTSANPEGNGGAPSINATDLTVNTTGVYITGKYAHSGWANDYDCSTGTASAFTLRSYSIGGFNFNSSGTDIGFFLTKFNSNGIVVWNKTGRDPSFCVNINNSLTPVWPYQIPTNPIITSDKANNIVCGFVGISTKGSFLINNDTVHLRASDVTQPYYLVVAKYNSAGTLQWSNNAGCGFNTLYNNDGAYQGYLFDCISLISDKSNNIFFLGEASDSTFFGQQIFRTNAAQSTFIAKISSAGVWQFTKELSNSQDGFSQENGQNPEKLAVDTNKNVYALVRSSGNPQVILGTTVSNSPINTSYYLVKMNNSGSLTWVRSFGNTSGNTLSNSIHFNNNNLYICGSNPPPNPYILSEQKLVFSQLYVPNVQTWQYNEFYAAKADLNGNFIWVTTFQDGGYGAYGNAIKALNGNVYISGEYGYKITSLGDLNGSFTNSNPGITNLFFGKLKDQYIKIGTVTPTNIIPGCTITIPFTSFGLNLSAGNTFTAELSNSYGDFTTPTAIGATISTGTGAITATIPASLTYGSGYRIRIHSSDTLNTGLNYYTYADTPYVLSLICPPPSAGFAATNITATSATVNWTPVGCASGYKVQRRVKGTTAWTTVNIATNTAMLNITTLTANTIYQWRVASKCKNNGTNSFSAFSSIKQFTTSVSFVADNIIADNKKQSSTIKIYPNPVNNQAELVFTSSKAGKYNVEITDLSGKILQEKNGNVLQGENKITLDVSSYANGMYLINITDDEHGKRILKLTKE